MREPKTTILFVALVAVVLLLTGCGSDGDGGADDAGGTTAESGTGADDDQSESGDNEDTDENGGEEEDASASASGSTGDGGEGDAPDDGGDQDSEATGEAADEEEPAAEALEPERVDWLTFARGLTFVSLSGLQSGSAATALATVDGDPRARGVTDDQGMVEMVFELPALTTFDRLAVPNIVDRPGNDSAVRFLTVEGSSEGPDSGWEVLADAEFELHDEEGQVTELELLATTPIRWVRLTMGGAIFVEEGDEGKTIARFSELIGNGTQEPIVEPANFDGLWELDLTERPDFDGKPLQLTQSGSTISGCWGDVEIVGSINGVIARATGFDPVRERESLFIFVADVDDGAISALVSENGGFFKPYITTDNPDIGSCGGTEPTDPTICDTSVYINFDVDSAVIRPESAGVLAAVFDLLEIDGAPTVSIVGHTSTEGSDAYNLDLSERRAQSVVDDLVARGYDPASLSAEGRGEAEPLISPDDTESAREINRRVHLDCG
ncbi:MAG: OmpA family protein [Actinomycetota bacterium]